MIYGKFITYGSIEQYRSVVRNAQKWFEHNNKPKGKLVFHGTVKLHGTNAGIGYDPRTDEMWAQSRSNIITPTNDNAGFATWVEKNKSLLRDYMRNVCPLTEGDGIKMVFGEWCGGNIQKGVAISGLKKMFVVFDYKLVFTENAVEGEPDFNKYAPHKTVQTIYNMLRTELEAINCYCIENFPTWDMEIDFSYPEASVQPLIDITVAVETECPVGKYFDKSGIGEGVVWQAIEIPNLRFKSKGEKHSDTHVKVIVAVDVEKVESIREFVRNVLTDHRMDKMVDMLKQEGLEVKPETTGNFLKLVMNDILKEETDTFIESGFVWKDLTGPLSKTARDWYLAKCQEF